MIQIRFILLFALTIAFVSCQKSDVGSGPENISRSDSGKSTPSPLLTGINNLVPLPTGEIEEFELRANTKSTDKFRLIDPKSSKIDFENRWDTNQFDHLMENSFISSGVAIGDIDSDGLPEVFLSRRSDGGRLFKNLGNFEFEDITERWQLKLNEMWGTGATFVDVNSDGRLDLYVCGYDCPNKLFINLGDRFEDRAHSAGLDFSGASVSMNFADYDNDGDLDGYLLTNRLQPERGMLKIVHDHLGNPIIPEEERENYFFLKNHKGRKMIQSAGQFDHLYRNDDGKFVEVTEECGIGFSPDFGLSATWWDYNEDGWPDLYVTNDFWGQDFLYRNDGRNGDGKVTFTDVTAASLPHTPWFSMGSEAADINNDGHFDLLAADMAGSNHYRDKLSMGPMSGPFSWGWFLNFPNPPQYMRNCLYLNTGTERFMEVAFLCGLAQTDWTWSIRFCDFDQDGWQDAFFTNGMSRDWFNGDYRKQATEINQSQGSEAKDKFWLEQPTYKLQNLAFRNKRGLKFEDVSQDWGLDYVGVNTGAATGDLDGDGDLDLVLNGFNEPARVYENGVAKGHSISIQLVGTKSNRQGVGARVEIELPDDQRQFRFVNTNLGFMSSSESKLHFGVGQNETIKTLRIKWPSGNVQEFNDLETNKKYVIVERETNDQQSRSTTSVADPYFRESSNVLPETTASTEYDYDDFADQPLIPNQYSKLGPGWFWADVDADGDDDFYLGGSADSPGQIVLNDGGGKFRATEQPAIRADKASEDMGGFFFDADQDGDLDLYVASGSNEFKIDDKRYLDRLYLNDGKGVFEKAENRLPEIGTSTGVVAGADFDRDGKVDLFVGGRIVPGKYPTAPRSYLLKNDGSKLVDVIEETAPELSQAGMVTSAIWSDVNRDSWMDLIVTYEWGPVRLFINNEGQLTDATATAGLDSRLGWFNSVCSGDIDNDGDMDFVVGNFGLNTKYYASDEKPELLFYGDFEGDGTMHIVEAKFENGVCLPRRGLGCTSDAIPAIKSKLPTFHEFAISPLENIYTNPALEAAQKFSINSLESFVLINESSESGGPRFRTLDLPRIAQGSPIFGCALVDVDCDRNLDLIVAQNFYGPQRETGYMDGGVSLMLKGDGSGNFDAVWPNQSGIVVRGDAKSLAVVDLNQDRKPDFVVGVNSSRPMVFENSESPENMVVRLVGPAGNPTAIGARIQVEYTDGSSRTFERSGGGSYFSQSTTDTFVGSTDSVKNLVVVWPDGKSKELRPDKTDTVVEAKYDN